MQESSIGKLGKQEGKRSRVKYEKGKKGLGKREAVCDITPLLTSFRCQCRCWRRRNSHTWSWGKKGRPCNLRFHCKSCEGEGSQFHHGRDMSNDGNIRGSDSPQCCAWSYHTNRTSCHCPCPKHVWHSHGLWLEPCVLFCPWSRGLGACHDRCDNIHGQWHWQQQVVLSFDT